MVQTVSVTHKSKLGCQSDLSNSTITRSIATMSISGLYNVESAASAELGGVSLLTAVVDKPDTITNKLQPRKLLISSDYKCTTFYHCSELYCRCIKLNFLLFKCYKLLHLTARDVPTYKFKLFWRMKRSDHIEMLNSITAIPQSAVTTASAAHDLDRCHISNDQQVEGCCPMVGRNDQEDISSHSRTATQVTCESDTRVPHVHVCHQAN